MTTRTRTASTPTSKEVVDALPPLTDEQRDLLAVIFRQRRR